MASNSKFNGSKQNGVSGGDAVGKHLVKNGLFQPTKRQKFINNLSGQATKLPVNAYKGSFFKLLSENQTLLVIGETGSGKTTQIPQWCLEYCFRKTKQSAVACTQPRRIAAMSVAARVAKEMKVTLGQEVGYSVRFEACTSEKTRLKYLTDGMLLREAMLDGLLTSYGVIILDEAHERTLQTEILFGVIKRALVARNSYESSLPPLKVVVMSATINVKLFKSYFNSPILQIEGRQHPVQDLFTEVPQSDLLSSTLICVFQVHRTCDEGDILVFCSGQDEIQSLIALTKKILKQAPESLKNLIPLPLYASLPAAHQMKVFECRRVPQTNGFSSNGDDSSDDVRLTSSFTRKVIFATNVAETSITIPNIKYVIDTGKVKCRTYCPKTGLESLKVTTISKAQAKQRSGRAGRVAPGTCYRLYTNEDYAHMCDYLPPEIKRCNLDGIILQMISIGIKEINTFDFLEKPDEGRIKAALTNLLNLKAIKSTLTLDNIQTASNVNQEASLNKKKSMDSSSDDDRLMTLSYELTAVGKKLCAFPLSPSMSRIILAANELNCLDEALTVVSLLAIENLFHIPPNKQSQAETMLQKFHSNEGDIIMLLKVFKAFKRTSLLNRTGLKIWCAEHFIHIKNLKMARLIRKQLADLSKSLGMNPSSCGQDTSILRRALTYGLFNNVATMWDGKYRNKSCNEIYIHPSSCLFRTRPECILYVEIVETNKCYMRNCTLIDMNWIREVSASNMRPESPTK